MVNMVTLRPRVRHSKSRRRTHQESGLIQRKFDRREGTQARPLLGGAPDMARTALPQDHAFARLDSEVNAKIRSWFRRKAAGCKDVADDLYQKFWCKLLEYRARYGEPERVNHLAWVVANSVLIDWLREKRRWALLSLQDQDEEIADTRPSHEEELGQVELIAEVLTELLRAVPCEEARELLAVDKHYAAILAKRSGIPSGTIRKRRERLLEQLRINPRLRELWLASLAP